MCGATAFPDFRPSWLPDGLRLHAVGEHESRLPPYAESGAGGCGIGTGGGGPGGGEGCGNGGRGGIGHGIGSPGGGMVVTM